MSTATRPIADAVRAALGDRAVKRLADDTGIPRSTLDRRLRDGNFSVAELFKVAHALGVPASTLMPDEAPAEAAAS